MNPNNVNEAVTASHIRTASVGLRHIADQTKGKYFTQARSRLIETSSPDLPCAGHALHLSWLGCLAVALVRRGNYLCHATRLGHRGGMASSPEPPQEAIGNLVSPPALGRTPSVGGASQRVVLSGYTGGPIPDLLNVADRPLDAELNHHIHQGSQQPPYVRA